MMNVCKSDITKKKKNYAVCWKTMFRQDGCCDGVWGSTLLLRGAHLDIPL